MAVMPIPDAVAFEVRAVVPTDYGRCPCPFSLNSAHDFEAHTSSDIIMQLHCRACGLILPDEPDTRVVHTYKGEGLTTCGLEVVGPCPDCAATK